MQYFKLKKTLFLVLFLVFSAILGYSQSSEKISVILNTEQVTLGQVAYLAGVYGFNIPEESNFKSAFEDLKRRKLVSYDSSENDLATLEQTAFIFMKATKMNGGLMYRITQSKRYAFKEFKARGIIPQKMSPTAKITGHDIFGLLNSCMSE